MEKFNIKNILIFGGSGFIGTNLVLDLIDKGLNLYVYDLNASKILKKLHENNKIKLIIGDFTKEKKFSNLLKNIDCVVHLIHTSIPTNSNRNKLFDIESNLIPSIKLFGAAVSNEVNKVIFISSGGKIYGNRNKFMPIKETSRTEPIYSYGITKLTIEKYLRLTTNNSKTKFIILRPSNPYGENYYYTNRLLGLINVSLLKLKTNEILTVWGNGENIRDYIYIKDLTDAIVKSIFIEQTDNYIINIGTGIGKSILEVIELIEKITSKKIKVNFLNSRKIDINYNVLDIKKSFEILNWKPVVTIKEGIRKTWNWTNNYLL